MTCKTQIEGIMQYVYKIYLPISVFIVRKSRDERINLVWSSY
jgi:hypothetical protein